VEAPAASLSKSAIPEGEDHPFTSVEHPLTVVLSPACDLDQQYNFRDDQPERVPFALSHVILLDLHFESGLRANPAIITKIFERIKNNQDERYHRLPSAGIASSDDSLPELFMDFKRAFSLPIDSIYLALQLELIERRAIVPAVYVHDLIHRFYSFLSRVGVPD